MLKLYNTLTRKKETFKPLNKRSIGMYSCGPTVYFSPHIGNFRTYIFSDFLKRVLQFDNYSVKQIINVTDVGHLTSDADTGEDKIESSAKKLGKSANEIAQFYFKEFKSDFKKLNILEPTIWSWATKHIKEQIELIKILEKKGFTYKTSDGIYFDSSKFKNYSKLAKLDISGLKAGKRISLGEKRNKTDFALWKFSEKPGIRQQEWNSPWGLGFPGWHIECSAMSMKYLGETFDIHTGGIDHIPIHHTNEIAQSESATDKKFVNYWLHGAFLNFKGEKISKSKGELFTISELEKKGFDPLVFRYLCLTTHYRKSLNFSLDNLKKAKESYERLRKNTLALDDDKKINKEYLESFQNCIDDDLNMPQALQVLWNLIKDEKAKGRYQTVKEMDKIFGLNLLNIKIPINIKNLADEREILRNKKDWKRADKLRQKIEKAGFTIDDIKEGGYVISGK